MRPRRSRSTTRSCGPRRRPSATRTMPASLVHDEVAQQSGLRLGARRQGGDRRRRSPTPPTSPRSTCVNNRLVPNAIEPRAAIGDYDARHRGLHALRHEPESRTSHRLVIVGLHRRRARAQAAGGGARRRRRLRLQDLHLRRGVRRAWASKKVGGRPVKWTAERTEAFLSDAHGRDHVTHAELAMDADGNFLALRVNTKANIGAYLSTFASCVPTYLYATLLAGQYKTPGDLLRRQAYLHQHRTGDAYRGAGRPEATLPARDAGRDQAAREIGLRPGRDPAPELHPQGRLPLPDAGRAAVRHRRLRGDARRGAEARRLCQASRRARRTPRPRASCAASASPATSRPAASRPRPWSARSAPASGLWESAKVRFSHTGKVQVFTGTHSHGQGHETTFAQLVAEKLGVPYEDVEVIHGDTDKTPVGMGTYGSRSLAVGGEAIVKACDKIIAKGKKIAAHLLEASRGRHRVQGRQVHGRRHRPGEEHRRGRVRGLRAAQLPAGPRAGHGGDGVLRSRRTSPIRPAPTSARSRSIRRPAWSRSSASSRSTTSAR